MSKLTVITDRALERALELAHTAGDGLKSAGGSLRNADWIKTGAAIGAVKTGGKAATKFVRRNPAVAVAAAAVGVGLLGYALYRKQQKKKAANGHVVNGQAQRINARDRRNDTVVDEHSDIGSDACACRGRILSTGRTLTPRHYMRAGHRKVSGPFCINRSAATAPAAGRPAGKAPSTRGPAAASAGSPPRSSAAPAGCGLPGS